jgi:hypothetical protein
MDMTALTQIPVFKKIVVSYATKTIHGQPKRCSLMRYLTFLALFFPLLANLLLVTTASAADRFYVEADAMRTEIKSSDGNFIPYNGKFKAGVYVRKQVALELQYVLKASKDANNSHLELNNLYGAYLRLDSQLHNRVRIYLLGGYSQADLSVTGPINSVSNEKGGGFSWGIGAEDQIVRLHNTYFTLEYMKYYSEGGFNISGISLGLRYVF